MSSLVLITKKLLCLGFTLLLLMMVPSKVICQKKANNRSNSIAVDFDSYYSKKYQSFSDTARGSVVQSKASIFDRLNPDSSEYHLLIICNQNYKDKEWSSLQWPIHDGKEIERVLTGKYNFKKQNVTFLIDPSRSQIYGSLQSLARKLKEKDNLIIFYAGHGIYDVDMNMGYWIPSDGEASNSSNWFANDELKRILKTMKTQHILVIADACFAGTLTRSGGSGVNSLINWDEILPNTMLKSRYGLKSRKVLTSGALEQVPDKSVFLESLVQILERNSLKYMVSEQLFDKVKRSIEKQTPLLSVITESGNEIGSDFIFRLKE